MASVITERELITELLKQYRKFPCLWDTSNIFYFNKPARNESYEKMLEVWRRLEPGGTVQGLKRKLEHFRAAYRREWKKVENSLVNGKIHNPSLWYYKHLKFLNMRTQIRYSSDEEDETEPVPHKKKKQTSERTEKPQDIYKTELQDTSGIEKQSNTQDYTTVYGLAIAKQLKELNESVRFEVERIISDVIYRARTGTLPKYTPQVVDNFGIPQSGPSWYDISANQATGQHTSSCLVLTVEEDSSHVIKTELNCDQY